MRTTITTIFLSILATSTTALDVFPKHPPRIPHGVLGHKVLPNLHRPNHGGVPAPSPAFPTDIAQVRAGVNGVQAAPSPVVGAGVPGNDDLKYRTHVVLETTTAHIYLPQKTGAPALLEDGSASDDGGNSASGGRIGAVRGTLRQAHIGDTARFIVNWVLRPLVVGPFKFGLNALMWSFKSMWGATKAWIRWSSMMFFIYGPGRIALVILTRLEPLLIFLFIAATIGLFLGLIAGFGNGLVGDYIMSQSEPFALNPNDPASQHYPMFYRAAQHRDKYVGMDLVEDLQPVADAIGVPPLAYAGVKGLVDGLRRRASGAGQKGERRADVEDSFRAARDPLWGQEGPFGKFNERAEMDRRERHERRRQASALAGGEDDDGSVTPTNETRSSAALQRPVSRAARLAESARSAASSGLTSVASSAGSGATTNANVKIEDDDELRSLGGPPNSLVTDMWRRGGLGLPMGRNDDLVRPEDSVSAVAVGLRPEDEREERERERMKRKAAGNLGARNRYG